MASHSKQIGIIGEQVLISEFTKAGIQVLTPIGDNTPYDFVVIKDNRFVKVQVKTAEYIRDGAMTFCTSISEPYKKITKKYTSDEVDCFGLYCIENGFIGLLPFSDYTSKDTVLRLNKPKNNQVNKIKLAEDYSFANQLNNI